MSSDFIVGIDVSKDNLTCSLVRTRDKSRLWLDNFSNDRAGITRLLCKAPSDAALVLEPTGLYGNAVVQEASAAGRLVLLAPGRCARAYRRSVQSRAVTDPIDSYALALFGNSRKLWQYRLKSRAVDEIDQHLTYRRQLSRTITALELQVRSLPLAAEQIRPLIDDAKVRLAELDKTIARLVKADPAFAMVGKLKAIPGFGPVTSAAVGSRLIHKQFDNPAQFVAYIGMDIGIVQSGKRKGSVGMTKQGDAELRRLLYLAAQASLRVKDSPFKAQYVRLLAKGKSRTQAICAIARKMAHVAWSMVRNQANYDPAKIGKEPDGYQRKQDKGLDTKP
jgi:transposase